ncbi:hypothetical protein DCAR_0625266 [Daucus carota subsp. sativus]|uniref:Uncharacterized protein n=1 Tax=Daucus carota subsp. sativus TaxID=79200 RepID=A0AAF0XDK1_DAUCS|nr:hypothetical protein DCAR_0625266 [Daucus carota subsp. sativus]
MTNVPKMKVVTEVAPPQFISVIRRPVKKMATIDEEEREIVSGSLLTFFQFSRSGLRLQSSGVHAILVNFFQGYKFHSLLSILCAPSCT